MRSKVFGVELEFGVEVEVSVHRVARRRRCVGRVSYVLTSEGIRDLWEVANQPQLTRVVGVGGGTLTCPDAHLPH